MEIIEAETSREGQVSTGYASVLRRYAGSILLLTLAALAGGLAITRAQTPVYTSVQTVVVEPQSFPNGAPPQQPDMGTEREIATSGAVAAVAAKSLNVPIDGVTQGLSVSVPVETHVLRFAYTSPSPAEAQRRANAFANAYIKYRTTQLAAPDTNGDKKPQVEPPRAHVITDASLPESPSAPSYPLNLGVALIIGVVLGIATAAVRDLLNDRLRGIRDLEARTGVPALAAVPPIRRLPAGEGAPLVMLRAPDSRTAEAFRYLRAKLLHAPSASDARKLVVTSAVKDEGRTVTAANLAVALALSGKRVALVCADLRQQDLPALFSVENGIGLTQVVGGQASVAEVLHDTGVDRLRLIPPGPLPSRAGDLITDARMREILADLGQAADIVVVDAPPVLASADTVALAMIADMVLLVADVKSSTRRGVQDASLEIEQAGGRLIGSVLTAGQSIPRGRRAATSGGPPAPTDGALLGALVREGRSQPSKVADATPAE